LTRKKKNSNIIYTEDARTILDHIPKKEMVTATITSPPYFDMKDYGGEDQIGFGQSYEEYLFDLQTVFQNVFQITKENGTLWIVIDTFKKEGQVVPLPFDLVSKLLEVGWLLQDIIIWKKDKTVPWSTKGFMQRKFEYILFFSKTTSFKYNKDQVRIYDTSHLKKWWVKYPERYNPRGKALDEVWEYPIPTQGSWGEKYVKHFCPLPTDMVGTMIQLTTDEKDIVMDPFAGSGSVLAQSAYMNREYLGFEINSEYVQMFKNYLAKTLKKGKAKYEMFTKDNDQDNFENTILNLRSLKYAKVLQKSIEKEGIKSEYYIYVDRIGNSDLKHKIIKVEYVFIGAVSKEDINIILPEYIAKPPLSKFGVEPIFKFRKRIPQRRKELFGYTSTNTHSFLTEITKKIDKRVKIISPIKVQLNENEF